MAALPGAPMAEGAKQREAADAEQPDAGPSAGPEPGEPARPISTPGSKKRKQRKRGGGTGDDAQPNALVPGQPLPRGEPAGTGTALALVEEEGDERLSLEVVPLGADDAEEGDDAEAVVPLDAAADLGWRERAKQKKLELAERKEALKARAAEMKLMAQAMKEGDLGSAGGCFQSEAAFDNWIDKVMMGLLVLVCVCSLAAQVSPWSHASSSYIAPYDGAETELDVTLSLWHGDFHLLHQAMDPPPPPPIDCWTDEHVVDGECVACVVGKTRPAGDDRTQGNTQCVNEGGLTMSVLNMGAVAEVNQSNLNGSTVSALPLLRPPSPPPTASGPLVEAVSAAGIPYGELVDLSPGMHTVIARVFELDGSYQLPPAPGGLWAARLLLIVSTVLAGASILTLCKLSRYHRAAAKRAIARRRRAMTDPPLGLVLRSRGLVVLCAGFSAIGFALGHNATVPTVGETVLRCCSMFAAACGSQTSVDIGAALALLGALAACLT